MERFQRQVEAKKVSNATLVDCKNEEKKRITRGKYKTVRRLS